MPENFKFMYPDTPGSSVYLSSFPIAITNYQYELKLNDAKSEIFILDKKYVYDFDREVRTYAKNLSPSVSFDDNISTSIPISSEY